MRDRILLFKVIRTSATSNEAKMWRLRCSRTEDWWTVLSVRSFVRPRPNAGINARIRKTFRYHFSRFFFFFFFLFAPRQWHLLHTDFIKSPVQTENESLPSPRSRRFPSRSPFLLISEEVTCLVNEFRRWILTGEGERERRSNWFLPRFFDQF